MTTNNLFYRIFNITFLLLITWSATAQSWQTLDSMGVVLTRQGKYLQADSVLQKAIILVKKEHGKQDSVYAKVLANLGAVYFYQQIFDKAENISLEIIAIYEKTLGKENDYYATSINDLAVIYQSKGLYAKSETLIKEVKVIREKLFGKEHISYAVACNDLGVLYFNQGLYEKSELFSLEAKELYKKLGNEYYYAQACNNLGALYYTTKSTQKSEILYIEAKNIREKLLTKKHPEYSESCNNLATLYLKQGLYEKAEPLLIEAKELRESMFGKKHPAYAQSCNNLSVLYTNKGLYEKSIPLLLEAKDIREKVLGKQHPDYINSCVNLAKVYQVQKLYEQAEPLFIEVNNNKKKQVKSLFPTLSEAEKQLYFKSVVQNFTDFTDFAMAYQPQKKEIIAQLYNQILFTKGIIFSSSQKMKSQILNSGDLTLISQFDDWKLKKNDYIKYAQMSIKRREKEGIDLVEKENEINDIEKNIVKKSDLFLKNTQNKEYKWEDVRNKLGQNEVVIEMVRTLKVVNIDSIGKIKTDTVYIALFITEKTKNNPDYLLIENGNLLEHKFFKYYKNNIMQKQEETDSYDIYWKPIADKLKQLNSKKFSTIYFSPDGVYHQINLNTLQNSDSKKFVLDEQNIQLIGTSRDLIELTKNKIDLSRNFKEYQAFMLGFPTYNLEQKSVDLEQNKERGLNFSTIQRVIGASNKIATLPATKTEVETLALLFSNKKIKVNTYLSVNANENKVKSLKNPTVLHIATHGFFIPEVKEMEIKTLEEAENRNLLKNPFMRSGLLLAGCQNIKADGEDGILSAEEAMNLSLDKTELVVLSACETGLGDVQAGEGVFGLQRAFQQAGAKTVVMSLWKVSDEATQQLMTIFYTELLGGKTKRDAFKIAQLKLRQKYDKPYYWGAFVMVGE